MTGFLTCLGRSLVAPVLLATMLPLASLADAATIKQHGVAIHGALKYPATFQHFDYANPNAPQGGLLRRHVIGTYDSFNPYIPQGRAAAGTGYLYDTLATPAHDEPFSQYGLLAHSIEFPADRSYVIYHLRPEARFSDGKLVTAEDVKFTFDLLTSQGSPLYAYYYADVTPQVLDKHRIKFSFSSSDNKELSYIVGQLPVLPKHYWENRDFSRATLETPVGSGPYKIASHIPGRRVVYEKRDDYWGKDLAVNRGHYNFAQLSFEYFLDETVALEAFKNGAYDLRLENTAKDWATGYQGPQLSRGDIQLKSFEHHLPAGMQGFVFNQRRTLFQNRELRRAIGYAFDFEWANQHLFYGQYRRTESYFQNSNMAAQGLPSKKELEILQPFREQLPPEVFSEAFKAPVTDGSGQSRQNLLAAQQILAKAGYRLDKGQLYSPDGTPVRFEILLVSPAFERVTLPFTRNLRVLGIHANVRRVDQPQYLERVRNFDFDLVVNVFPQSNSPGNEQRDFWHSSAASRNDSRNLIGLQDPVVDALVELLIQAPTLEDLEARCKALDRVLQWGYHLVPHWHINQFRVAHHK